MRHLDRIALRVKESEARLADARHAVSRLTQDERQRFVVELMGQVEDQAERERREREVPRKAPGDCRTWHLAGEAGRTLCNRAAQGLRVAQTEAETDTLCARCRRAAEWRDAEGRSAADRPRKAPSYRDAVERVLADAGRPLGSGEVFELARKLLPGAKLGTVTMTIEQMRAEDPPRVVQGDVGPHGPLYVLATGGAAAAVN